MIDKNAEYATFIMLKSEINKILFNYMEIYDEYYSNNSRDSAHSNYAVEKLNSSKRHVESCIKYFENRKEK